MHLCKLPIDPFVPPGALFMYSFFDRFHYGGKRRFRKERHELSRTFGTLVHDTSVKVTDRRKGGGKIKIRR